MALVGVEDLGRGVAGDPGEDAQRPHAADAEEQLLAQPVLAVAAVQPVGHVAVVVGVALDVGVEHQQRHPADAGDPDPGEQLGAVGHRDGDRRALAVLLAQQRDRQSVGVEDGVGLLLPALAGQRLLEVAVLVEQADADDRYAEVAGGLQVVAGQDAEAAGVLRQHGGDAELRARSSRSRPGRRRRPRAGAGTTGHRSGSASRSARAAAEARQEGLVARASSSSRARPTAPSSLTGSRPVDSHRRAVDGLEDVLGLGVPGPAQVAGEIAQRGERRRAARDGR